MAGVITFGLGMDLRIIPRGCMMMWHLSTAYNCVGGWPILHCNYTYSFKPIHIYTQ